MLLWQISALLSASPFFSSSLRWQISAFCMSHSWMPRIASKHSLDNLSQKCTEHMLWVDTPVHTRSIRTTVFDVSHTHTHTDCLKARILLMLNDPPLSAVPSSLSVSVSSGGKKKEESHLFHFCPRFSAVSRTTVAENIPLKDSANGVSFCLGGCSIGVSGASSRVCICNVFLYMQCMHAGGWVHVPACIITSCE